ncbi:hypothetical protein SISNIDRAFT_96449 [Sistotremastrum niveocremeum HHB9708]|uniref:non-specific serine/threonine protein kinase n=1 Tax=Sistotremastrum niveocremeum HHB9708 TaxID=1314777 RepID=A0A164U8C1_9AGAM|nr:hypothetical protein SISNIDRAFT_96449 [Sistotremastrum niveocremeum HHB9708]
MHAGRAHMTAHHPQTYIQQAQNGAMLQPGQTILVNTYTIQVERYLSQGGYAHVYLVQSAQPVLGTTRHVLKRIAVADETMLKEVQKEVDVMRILRGHPNIVHLIDASWNRLSNGTFEVFILMEFCSGGGIIDMMNRRLRERLTESEILQIFCDVCEAVAAMHNLRPALLHRDLKVENILQASATLFKLCDFGSATAVLSHPPSTLTELKALEADLNRHTTLQYRAPEMVDVFQRRPVDEKSDIWALGVLLYKLCYYTTPFEEHGPLAILNAQFKIPPYPVYSHAMNALIASMLKEHGSQRPSVFDLLNVVHRMRGTQSLFKYKPSEHALSSSAGEMSSLKNPLTVASSSMQSSSSQNTGQMARQKVLEAITPMRRGRLTSSHTADNSKPHSLPSNESPEELQETARIGNSTSRNNSSQKIVGLDDAWNVKPSTSGKRLSTVAKGDYVAYASSTARQPVSLQQSNELGDSFGEAFGAMKPTQSSTGFGDSFMPARSKATSRPIPEPSPTRPDAFHGLDSFQPSTASMPKIHPSGSTPTSSLQPSKSYGPSLSPADGPGLTSSTSPRPSPQPRSLSQVSLRAEERFPSIEELDTAFRSPSLETPAPELPPRPSSDKIVVNSDVNKPRPHMTGNLKFPTHLDASIAISKSRSQQTTGTAMRNLSRAPAALRIVPTTEVPNVKRSVAPLKAEQSPRPPLERRHRSSVSIRSTTRDHSLLSAPSSENIASGISPQGEGLDSIPPRDWLTGDDSSVPNSPAFLSSLRSTTESKISSGSEPSQSSPQKPSASVSSIADAKDSSSDPDEGPEDLEKTVRVSESKRPRHKGRQSSVHDLVNLWDGQVNKTDGPPSTPKVLRRASLIHRQSTMEPPRTPPKPDALRLRQGKPAPTEVSSSFSSNKGGVFSRPTTQTVSRPRPSSMYVMPSSSRGSPEKSPHHLIPPSPTIRTPRSRRNSISEVVDKYEAIASTSAGSQQASSPIPSILNSSTPSTSPVATVFPPLSPVKSGAYQPSPSTSNNSQKELDGPFPSIPPSHKTSPLLSSQPLHVVGDFPSPSTDTLTVEPDLVRKSSFQKVPDEQEYIPHNATRKEGLRGSSPRKSTFPQLPVALASLIEADSKGASKSERTSRPESPEKTFQGVGRLIDQWQKKTAQNGDPQKVTTRPIRRMTER